MMTDLLLLTPLLIAQSAELKTRPPLTTTSAAPAVAPIETLETTPPSTLTVPALMLVPPE